jgi:signal transduction histidine kinase
VPPEGPDEVRRVADSFNTMAAQVKATQAAQRDFVANVSHDLKTPLTAISGWSQALLDGAAETPDELQHAAETIYNEAARMARLVNDLLDLARMESGQLQLQRREVDLSEVITDVYRSQLPRARARQIDLRLDALQALPVYGDPDRLAQVFTNLVDNALTYTPSGGEVRLATRAANGSAEGIVTDTGPGIPEAELPRVFERFYRLEKSRARSEDGRGSGLGLAIVAELVAAQGGQVSVTSQVGRGTAFVVRLPTA